MSFFCIKSLFEGGFDLGTIKCPSCSAEVDDTMLFCPNCFNEFGGDSAGKTEKPEGGSSGEDGVVVCPSCGEKFSKGMLFCPFCFSEVGEDGGGSDRQESAEPEEEVDPSLLIDGRYVIIETYKDGADLSICKVRDRNDRGSAYSLRGLQLAGDSTLTREQAAERFDAVVSEILKITHPGLARVFDYFHSDSGYYILYDFTEGTTLTKFLQNFHSRTKKAMPEGMLVSIALKLCDIADAMHRNDPAMYLIDLKPSSIIVSDDVSSLVFVNPGLPYLQDALGVYSDSDIDGSLFGGLKSVKRDLWCIGAVLYFLVSGLDLQMFETLEPSPVSSLRKDFTPAFSSILEKLLGSGRVSGYSSVEELRADLTGKCRARGIETYDFYYDLIGYDSSSEVWFAHMGNQSRTGSMGGNTSLPMRQLWTFAAAAETSSSIAPFGDSIAVVFNDGRMFVLEAKKGGFIWNCNMREKLNPVISDGSRIFASSSYSPSLFCFAPGTEAPSVWKAELEGMLMTAPILYGGTLYQTSYTGSVYAVDPDDGSVKWHESLDAMTISSPVISDDTLITAGLNGVVYAFSLEKKRIVWQYETGGNISLPCSLLGDSVAVVDTSGCIYNVDARTAVLNWKLSADSPLSGAVRALRNMYVFISQKGIMYNVSPGGDVVWRLKLGGPGEYAFSVTNNRAYVFAPDGRILIIDLFTGRLIDKNSVKMKLSSDPVICGGRLFFAQHDGTVFCYG